MRKKKAFSFLRYPGGKQRHLQGFAHLLPNRQQIHRNYVEPFVGGGAVFFSISPNQAILSDINKELIDLYRGVRRFPNKVWEIFNKFEVTRDEYYQVRSWNLENLDLSIRAARLLYLNRTCFKGMWRHNASGVFNVGYGGQDRRWVIHKEDLKTVSNRLKNAKLKHSDFEQVIDNCEEGDFIFLDPPYRPCVGYLCRPKRIFVLQRFVGACNDPTGSPNHNTHPA
jgi:DNA adenine methylase